MNEWAREKAKILVLGFTFEPLRERREDGKLLCNSCQQYPSGCFCSSKYRLEKEREIASALIKARDQALEEMALYYESAKQGHRIRFYIDPLDVSFYLRSLKSNVSEAGK